ncbi:MAG: glycoside hydrolase family protein, partial [Planctomycetota bacterium]
MAEAKTADPAPAPHPGVAGSLPAASRKSLEDKQARAHLFADPEYFQWGGSVIRDEQGTYHMFYARWRRDNPRGMYGWQRVSEIARATADRPEGPYHHQEVVLKGFGKPQPDRWDAVDAHNPCITMMMDPVSKKQRYYLYFVATRDDNNMKDDWWDHAINQRVGVAVADSLEGPWKRHPEPVITPPTGALHHFLVNPGVCQLPDGRFLMVLKGRAPGAGRHKVGPQAQGWALADRPEGPFIGQDSLLIPPSIPAEDPCVWIQDSWIFAAFKDWHGKISGKPGISFIRGKLQTDDTISWNIPKKALISGRMITWDDGRVSKLKHLERPFILLDDEGRPSHLFAAASTHGPYVNGAKTPRDPGAPLVPLQNLPFNLCLPLSGENNTKGEDLSSFIRLAKRDQTESLDVALTTYTKGKVSVTLHGALHIAEKSYYDELNRRFGEHDSLLFEGVGDAEG